MAEGHWRIVHNLAVLVVGEDIQLQLEEDNLSKGDILTTKEDILPEEDMLTVTETMVVVDILTEKAVQDIQHLVEKDILVKCWLAVGEDNLYLFEKAGEGTQYW